MNTQILRHVPWTCRWGHFGGPVAPATLTPGFVFWVCARPQDPPGPRALDLDSCEKCPYWESATDWVDSESGGPVNRV